MKGPEKIWETFGYDRYLDCDDGFMVIDITQNAPNHAL